MSEETMSQAVDRLTAAGYTTSFRAEPEGLVAASDRSVHAPESFVVDEVVRFEGCTNPADEGAVFALRSRRAGLKGTFAVAYGPKTHPVDAEMMRRLG